MPDASLRSWLIPGHPLPIEQALLFALQIARGMQHATEKIPGLVHRDLKPENILVGADKLPETNINRLRVTDFGLIKTIADSSVATDLRTDKELNPTQAQFTYGVGTPLYMAPEQWKGEPVGVSTDVYALGCILYEMVSGQFAAEGKTTAEIQTSHCDGRLRPRPANLSQDLMELIEKSVALDSDRRYSTWKEIKDALEKVYEKYSGHLTPKEENEKRDQSYEEQVQYGWSYNVLGGVYLSIGNIPVALQYLEKALAVGEEKDAKELSIAVLGNLGNSYAFLGNSNSATRFYEKALAISREIGSRQTEGSILGNLGAVYQARGEYQRAAGNYERHLDIAREFGDLRGEANALCNLGNLFAESGDVHKAIHLYNLSLAIYRTIGARSEEGDCLISIGEAYRSIGDRQKAVSYYEQALVISREIGNQSIEGTALSNLGTTYKESGNIKLALAYDEQALAILRESGHLKGVATASYNLATIYSLGDIEHALSLAQEAALIWTTSENPRAKDAIDLVSKLKDLSDNSTIIAFQALMGVASLEELQTAIVQFPFMTNNEFIEATASVINEKIPTAYQAELNKRLIWLRQLADK